MIVKMKFINISGPRNDIDRVTDLYLSRYEIQLESALSELKTVDNLRPFVELNPYRDVLSKANQFVGYLPNADDVTPDTSLGLADMFELVRKEDVDELMRDFPTTRLHYVASDGCALLLRDAIDAMDDDAFALYLNYHFATCERADLLGVTSHALDVFRK